jgi:hypothetical protein
MMRVRVEIDEIVLDGVDVADPVAFRTALETALSDLAAQHSGPYAQGSALLLRGAAITPSTADGLGRQVAQSVWNSIVPGGTP